MHQIIRKSVREHWSLDFKPRPDHSFLLHLLNRQIQHCWFTADFMAGMLPEKNKKWDMSWDLTFVDLSIYGNTIWSAYFVLYRHCPPRLAFAICGQRENVIVNLNKPINEWKPAVSIRKCWIPRHSVPPLFLLVGVLWRTKHDTIDAILIQWHANKWQGILQLSPLLCWHFVA